VRGAPHEIARAVVAVVEQHRAGADGDGDGAVLPGHGAGLDLAADHLPERLGPFERRLVRDEDAELRRVVTPEDIVRADHPGLHEAGDLAQDVVAGRGAVHVGDAPHVIDGEEQEGEGTLGAAAPRDLPLGGLDEVPLVVDLRRAIHDAGPVDLLVAPRLDVRAGEKLEDRHPDLDAVAVLQGLLSGDPLVVVVGAVAAAEVLDEPRLPCLLEAGVVARDRIPFEPDVAVAASADRDRGMIEVEALAEVHAVIGVDGDQARGARLPGRMRRVLEQRLGSLGEVIHRAHPDPSGPS
jgi:hypothetical protein